MAQARGDAGLSAENVSIVRDVLEEWNRGDVDALVERVTDDFEWHPALVQSVEGAVFRGPGGFREFLAEWTDTWESWQLEAEDFRDLDNQVLALTRVRAKGRASGVEIDQAFAHLFELRDHQICRAQTFFDRDQALTFAEGGGRGREGGVSA